jgi:hypothetical protein
MSEFKPTVLWLKEKIYADEYKQKARGKLLKFIEDNPEMEKYIDWMNGQRFNTGMLIGFLFTVALVILVAEGYLFGVYA